MTFRKALKTHLFSNEYLWVFQDVFYSLDWFSHQFFLFHVFYDIFIVYLKISNILYFIMYIFVFYSDCCIVLRCVFYCEAPQSIVYLSGALYKFCIIIILLSCLFMF
jgi:hypothetical protein